MREVTPADLAGWIAFERIEGYSIGERGAWERAAMLAQLSIEPHRDAKKRPIPFSALDFLPWIEKPRRPVMTQRAWRAQFSPNLIVKQPKKEQ